MKVVSHRIVDFEIDWMRTYVPSRSSIITLSDIVISFTMATKKQDLVIDVLPTLEVQSINVFLELLPLRGSFWAFFIGGVSTIKETKIGESLKVSISDC